MSLLGLRGGAGAKGRGGAYSLLRVAGGAKIDELDRAPFRVSQKNIFWLLAAHATRQKGAGGGGGGRRGREGAGGGVP